MSNDKQVGTVDDGLFFTSILTMIIAVISVIEVVAGTLYFNSVFVGGGFKEFFYKNPILISVLTFIEANGAVALSGATIILGAKTKREHSFSSTTIFIGILGLIVSIIFIALCVKIFYLGLA